jgi:LysR family transcriptional regulator, benzoate and cis,cis-muconate-responsive activator of ben and cat genes
MNASLRQLQYFRAVADELSFTRAAERLHVAQPAVSAQIRNLERDLGVPLLRRTTRRVELTEAGQSFADDTRALLDGLDAAWERARRIGRGVSGRLRIAYTSSTAYEALPLILDELETRAPELQVSADQLWAAEVEAAVMSGDADVGLVRLPNTHEGLVEYVLRREPLAVFASSENPLVAQATAAVADLQDRVILTVPQALAPGFHDLVVELCRHAGFAPSILDITAPGHREPLLSHLSHHPEQVFVGPVSIASMPWPGVRHVLIGDPMARMPLSIIVRDGTSSGQVAVAVAAANAVAERELWLSADGLAAM